MRQTPAIIERRTAVLLLTVIAICTLVSPRGASAQSPHPRTIRIRVDSILAANTGEGMDNKLSSSPIGKRLKQLFEYTTYRLVMHQEQQTLCGRKITFETPGGRILNIAPLSVVDNMISMELVFFEGTRPVMTTELRLINHAVLVLGGPRYQQGMLITMISTDAADSPSIHRGPPEPLPLQPPPGLPDIAPIPADASPPPQH
jgi:hypothetical protein